MHGRIVVMEPARVRALARDAVERRPTWPRAAAALFRALGCSGCHGAQSTVHAPTLEGLYGSPVPLPDGTHA